MSLACVLLLLSTQVISLFINFKNIQFFTMMATRSKMEEKSVDPLSTSVMNTYDLAGIEEMDPSLGTNEIISTLMIIFFS